MKCMQFYLNNAVQMNKYSSIMNFNSSIIIHPSNDLSIAKMQIIDSEFDLFLNKTEKKMRYIKVEL